MEIRRLIVFGLFVVAGVFASCNDGQSDLPEISNLTVTPLLVEEFTDTVTISFDYYDLNGDIGNPEPNITSLSVKDSRLENADLYHVQPLAPVGEAFQIEGRLSVRLNNLFILGNDTVEELQFSVQLEDRKGNMSNLLESDTIIVYRP